MEKYERKSVGTGFVGLWVLLLALARPGATEARGEVEWVWSGAVTTTSAVVKAKVVGAEGSVRLFVSDRSVSASPDANGIVQFQLEDLRPAEDYSYRVELDGAPPPESLEGHFRTFARGAMSFGFVFGSCARTGSNHPVFATMESLHPLFVLHMGDFHYENITDNDPARFRQAFDKVLSSERQSSLYRSAPIAYMWDDHDFGPNDSNQLSVSKPAALATYDEVVPHYPLRRSDGQLRQIYQAFTVGRVRFLLTDVRSERMPDSLPDGPDKTMLGVAQRDWLLSELAAARDRYALVVWVNPVPWITEVGSGHGWGRYAWERRFIADEIRSLGMVNRLVMLSGDAHMVAIDDGANSNFATDAPPGEPAFPVVHAAPFDRYARPKGGPYSEGRHARRILFGLIPIQQFGHAEVHDDGTTLEMTLTGRDEEGDVLDRMSLTLRCGAGGCNTLP